MKLLQAAFNRIYFLIFAIPIMYFFLAILGILIFTAAITIGEKPIGKMVYIYNILISKIIRIKIETSGQENIIPEQSYIVIANHRSYLDPTILYNSLKFDFRWIMKIELLRIPVFGFICKRMGNIAIDRKDRESAIKSINEVKKRISDGRCIAFFSEGTRFNGDGMLPFKKGAFHFAIDSGIPILPVTINYADKIMPKTSFTVNPGTAKVIIHSPINVENCTESDIEKIKEKTREVILSGLDTSYVKI